MIGRGSRVTESKKKFTIVDLGNNLLRFGPWNESVDWNHIFKYPEMYLENIRNDEDIERDFVYTMPDQLKAKFKNSDLSHTIFSDTFLLNSVIESSNIVDILFDNTMVKNTTINEKYI